MSASISLATLVAAVRASAIAPRVAEQEWDDAHISDVVRTASTVKGAIWLATRALPAATPAQTTLDGRWTTALACLQKLADAGDEQAQHLLDAHAAQLVGPVRAKV